MNISNITNQNEFYYKLLDTEIKIVLWGDDMNLKDFFKIEDVEFTDEELELPYETYVVDKSEQIWYNISIITYTKNGTPCGLL